MKFRAFSSCVLFLFLGLLALPGPAHAKSPLALVMKKMGADLRKVMDQVAMPELNSSSASYCADLLDEIGQAAGLVPDMISRLPPGKQAGALLQYREDLTELRGLVEKLRADFTANDNASAAIDFKRVIAQRNNGHQAFAPDENGIDLDFPGAGLIAHCGWLIGPSLTDEAILQVTWRSKTSGAPVSPPGGFAVSLVMPSMPEMHNPPVTISPGNGADGTQAAGLFQVSGIYFTMAGDWSVLISLGRESVHLDLTVNANP